MVWLELAGAVVKLVALIFSKWFERDEEIKKQKAAAQTQVTQGIKTRDRSQITAGFAKLKNL